MVTYHQFCRESRTFLSVFTQVTTSPSLSREECEELIRCLEMGLAVFNDKTTPLSGTEVQLKSMLSALRTTARQYLNAVHDSSYPASNPPVSRS